MAMSISTPLAGGLLSSGSLSTLMTGMRLYIYGGTPPANADAALGSAFLLCTVTVDDAGTALSFNPDAVANVIEKNAAEQWSGTNADTGTATFCRLALPSDAGGSATSEVRIQGDVGIAGRFLNLSSVALDAGAVQTIDSFSIAMPTQ